MMRTVLFPGMSVSVSGPEAMFIYHVIGADSKRDRNRLQSLPNLHRSPQLG